MMKTQHKTVPPSPPVTPPQPKFFPTGNDHLDGFRILVAGHIAAGKSQAAAEHLAHTQVPEIYRSALTAQTDKENENPANVAILRVPMEAVANHEPVVKSFLGYVDKIRGIKPSEEHHAVIKAAYSATSDARDKARVESNKNAPPPPTPMHNLLIHKQRTPPTALSLEVEFMDAVNARKKETGNFQQAWDETKKTHSELFNRWQAVSKLEQEKKAAKGE